MRNSMKHPGPATRVARRIGAGVLVVLLLLYLFLRIGYAISENNIRVWKPAGAPEDIAPLLEKEILTEEDYALLYRQTGLTRIGVDRARARGPIGRQRILDIQKSCFEDHGLAPDAFFLWTCTDYMEIPAVAGYLEDGDIIVTASTHLSAWRIGHAGLVVNAADNQVLQAAEYGEPSCIGTIADFTNRINFMILRPRASAEIKQQVVTYAKENLVGLPYTAFLGTGYHENVCKTHCAHLVWYAYHAVGYELIDGDRRILLPYDLSRSGEVELVQTFGFDPESLWERLFH